MTVERVKKSSKKTAEKKTESFMFLDNLMNKIDALECEDQVPELFEDEELLKESFKSLLTLMGGTEADDDLEDFDCDKVDESVMEIMTKFLEEGVVEEEEFEDFFTDELAEEESEGEESEDDEEYDSDNVSVSESESKDDSISSEASDIPVKTGSKKMTVEEKKKAKNMKELEMLMEKVEDESDFETETEDDEDQDDEDDENVLDDNDDDDDMVKKDIFEDDNNTSTSGGRLSSFEKSQLALKEQIAALESEQLESQKPWSLRGEINARQRPSDSLLEEAVDFDNLSRPTPTITEERTEEIEDVIRRRIGEAAWDDVERKDGRDLTLLNGMQAGKGAKPARALLEDVATADPQRSLTQVYEDEATTKLTGSTAKDQETLDKQAELTALFAKICRHVDGLSGNRFAPKVYVQSDFQIKTLGKK